MLDVETRARERLMLGLRLDEPLPFGSVADSVDREAAERLAAGGLIELAADGGGTATVALTRRGRFLGGGVTVELLT